MRNFDWIFNAEGKVAEGKECVYDNCSSYDWDWYLNKPQVVTLAGYRPYYIDGTSAIAEARLIFVCRKVFHQRMGEENFDDRKNLEKWYPDRDMHTMYMGEIVKVLVKED